MCGERVAQGGCSRARARARRRHRHLRQDHKRVCICRITPTPHHTTTRCMTHACANQRHQLLHGRQGQQAAVRQQPHQQQWGIGSYAGRPDVPSLSSLSVPPSPHLRDAVSQLLVVHGDTLGLVQGHQRARQELLQGGQQQQQQQTTHTKQSGSGFGVTASSTKLPAVDSLLPTHPTPTHTLCTHLHCALTRMQPNPQQPQHPPPTHTGKLSAASHAVPLPHVPTHTLCSSLSGSAKPLMMLPRISSSSAIPLWCSVSNMKR